MKIYLYIVLQLVGGIVFSQSSGKEFTIGKTFTHPSELLGDEREIQVFLPDGYNESEEEYPVLYILDGQRYFLHGISLQQSFTNFKETPAYIIVGIIKNPSDRNRNYSSNANNYLSYLESDVVGFIDREYRTSNERILFGWAYAGGFVVQALINKPNLFDGYIAASPFPLDDKLNALDSTLSGEFIVDKYFFFSAETSQGAVKDGAYKLNNLLQSKASGLLEWTYRKLENEEHRSTPFTTLYHGLRGYFLYYPELQLNSLEEFEQAGGLPYVYDYYQRRAEEYGFQAELSDWTMFSLIRNTMRVDNLMKFDMLVDEFQATGFLKRIRISRSSSMASFYLKHEQYEDALKLFTMLNEQHPSSSILLAGLADAYKGMGDEEKASIFYERAKQNN